MSVYASYQWSRGPDVGPGPGTGTGHIICSSGSFCTGGVEVESEKGKRREERRLLIGKKPSWRVN